MTRKVDGRKGRGRPRVKLVDRLANFVGGGIRPAQLFRKTEIISEWRTIVANVLEIRHLVQPPHLKPYHTNHNITRGLVINWEQ